MKVVFLSAFQSSIDSNPRIHQSPAYAEKSPINTSISSEHGMLHFFSAKKVRGKSKHESIIDKVSTPNQPGMRYPNNSEKKGREMGFSQTNEK